MAYANGGKLDDKTRSLVKASQIFRLGINGVLFLDLPLTTKLLIIYASDSADCAGVKFFGDEMNCSTKEYQISDKQIDLASYLCVFAYIWCYYTSSYRYILFLALLIRALGVALFSNNPKKEYLRHFPDFFRELSVYFALMEDGFISSSSRQNVLVTSGVVVAKTIFERYWHS